MKTLGFALPTTEETEFYKRVAELWEIRLAKAKTDSIEVYHDELSVFGRWFTSGRLETDWALRQLYEVLKLGVKVDVDSQVAKKLVTLSQDSPLISIQCIHLLIRNSDRRWGLKWKDSIRETLEKVFSGNNGKAIREGKIAVNWLASEGYPEFKGLL